MTALARLVTRHPRAVVLAWALGLAAALVPAGALEQRVTTGGYDVPGSQSLAVADLSASAFDRGERERLFVVLRDPSGPALGRRIVRVQALLRDAPELASARLLPPRRADGLAIVPFTVAGELADVQQRIPELAEAVRRIDGQAALLGQAAVWHETTEISQEDLTRAEAIALPLTLVVLVVAFLSVVAAGIPIALAAASLLVTFGVLSLLALVLEMSIYVTNTASMICLGLAIDYSLFVVSRYRELRASGEESAAAIEATLHTTGRAILFSGVTVALGLSSLAVVGLGIFASMAIGASLAAAIAALGALTFAPAVLMLLGPRVDRLTLKRAARAADAGHMWHALARAVLRRPAAIAAGSCILLVLCALPLTGSRLTFAGTEILLPPGNELRAASDAVGGALGAGALGPIEVVTDGSPRAVRRTLLATDGIAAVGEPERGRDGWVRIAAIPTVASNTPAGVELVRTVRERLAGAGGGRHYVGGESALGIDLIDRIESRFPWMIVTACSLSFLLLLVAFRSLVIPLKAVLTNLLSVAATLGLVSLLFEGIGNADGIAWFVPPFLFAIVFGLSMDYEIFLLSRVREHHLAGEPNERAVAQALVRSARPITLAALVMLTVFIAFSLGRLETFRQLGVGMAIAVLLDATVVRCALVPSALVLFGEGNWWLPGWLARLLPATARERVPVRRRSTDPSRL